MTGEKRCSECGEVKSLKAFYRNRSMRDGLEPQCKDCRRVRTRNYYRAHPEVNRAHARAYAQANPAKVKAASRAGYARARNLVLDHYGRACACCGAVTKLTIDHKNGDGHEHRAEIGHGANRLYRWLIAQGFPEGFQTLCQPCNWSKGRGDRCHINHGSAVSA